MFKVLQEHQKQNWAYRRQLLLESWNDLASATPAARRLIPFFGSSNLFAPYSMDRQLAALLRRTGPRDIVLNLGSFGFGDSQHVLETTLALLEAYRNRSIDLLIYEVTPNEMPPLSKEILPSIVRRERRERLVLDHSEGQPILDRLRRVPLPLQENLERLAALAAAAPRPFPVIILDYESNLREWPPTLSCFSRPLASKQAADFRLELERGIECVRAGRLTEAGRHLDACDTIDADVAITAYLRAKVVEGDAQAGAAEALYRRARSLDLIRGRLARDSLVPDLEAWCERLGFWFISVPEIVRACSGPAIPGFNVFVDDVHYRPAVHFAIARAIAARLHRHGFLADDVSNADGAEIVRAVDRQRTFTLLQSALNLVLVPASPYNDERVQQGMRYLEEVEQAGCDAQVLDQYRMRFFLLAGLSEPLAGVLERRNERVLDPAALLFGTQGRVRDERRTEAPLAAEIEKEIRSLLLFRFGVDVDAEHEHVELARLGVDSLGLFELIFALEDIFDVQVADEGAAGIDHRLTFAMLRDRIGERLVQPMVQRLAHEKSLARHRILARRSIRKRRDLRLRPSPLLERSLDDWAGNVLPDVLNENFRAHRDRPAITLVPAGSSSIEAAETLTWGDLDRLSSGFASLLHDAGLHEGEVVHLMTGHGRDTVAAIVGALRLGAVPSVGNEPSPKISAPIFLETFGEVLRRSDARVVLTGPQVMEIVRRALAGTGGHEPRVLSAEAVEPWLAGGRRCAWPRPAVQPEALALLQHSSGTTGARKGVMLSHQAILRHTLHYARAIDLREDDRIASWLPLYHDMGLIACFVLPLLTGIPVAMMSPFDWVSAPHLLFSAIARERSSLVWLPNFAFNVLVDRIRPEQIEGFDLSSLRAVINCSEPVRQEAWERSYDRFAFHGLSRLAYATCYAMAENTFAVAQGGVTEPVFVDFVDAVSLRQDGRAVPRHEQDANVVALPSSGRPIEGCQVRVVSEAGGCLPVADRCVGEIEIASDSLATGYHNNDEATRRAFRGGWYRTGDLGYLADNQLIVLGRKDETIVVAGQNIFPADIEAVVSRQPGVRPGRVVAFGVRDERLGTEQVVVLAEPSAETLGPEECRRLRLAIRACLHDLLQIGVPNTFLVRPHTLRKTSSGKISRRKMRDLFLDGGLNDRLL